MIDKNGRIKEMELETYTNDKGEFVLELSQTPFGDLAIAYKINKAELRKSAHKSKYFEDSSNNQKLLDTNIDLAKEWFHEDVLGN